MSSAVIMASWRARTRSLGESPLLRASVWLTVANLLVGLMGYIYQILMGHMLIPGEFALFSAIMALFMFSISPLGAMFMVISRRVSTLRARNQTEGLRSFYWRSHEVLFGAAVLFLLLLWTLIGPAQDWLKATDSTPIWLFGASLIFAAFYLINNAFFQGLQRFGWLGSTGILLVGLKIGLSVSLIGLGLGVSGALLGFLVATAFTWMVGVVITNRDLPQIGTRYRPPIEPIPLHSILPVLVANVAFAAMTQLDMVLVNAFFSSEEAGLYAAASVLGKAVLYLPGGLVLALFPLVAENHANDRGSALLLMQAVVLVAGSCGLVALAYWFLADWIIPLFYGAAYTAAADLLRWYGVAVLPLTLVMVAEYFLIAKGRVLFAWLFLAIAPLQILAIASWHEELWQVITAMGICGALLTIIGYSMLWREYQRPLPMKI